MKKILTLIASLCVFVACSQEKDTKPPKTVQSNPILLADPTIFYNKGTYYLYGTTTGNIPNGEGFQVYTSSDLKKWNGPSGAQNGLALKKGDSFGDKGFWAPQILEYNKKFYMIYTANENIAIAVSDSPLGPFKNESKKAIIESGNQIDPFIFIDEDGKKYLYHVRLTNGNRIFVAEINDDLQSIKPETLTECISGTLPWENTENKSWPVTEGPTVLKHNGLYYLIYSANDFRNPDYAVGYATSKSPLGPWEKSADSPVISRKNTNQNGIGHGDVFWDKDNKMHYVLHTHYTNSAVSPRKAGIIDLSFEGNKIKAESKSFVLFEK
ncbi:glycoside hydrolase family 43 protein [Flavobacterium sp. 1355]|uniref:glycoside hydrolase family 43 protein n=1 Tax=Flavobacterium sp. 1355 TaxID=2806571 RepID=UPI001AE30D25|nr:glycoside hydrolase family 43 protein [Flavobacterium sp. 1355]MBP1222510.1 beta-xylosidase [Flavobacterium sp. 1355]